MEPALARRAFTVEEYHLMARTGILHEDDRVELEVWIVSITEDRIEVYSHPHDGACKTTRHAGRGESLTIAAFPDVSLPVDEILG